MILREVLEAETRLRNNVSTDSFLNFGIVDGNLKQPKRKKEAFPTISTPHKSLKNVSDSLEVKYEVRCILKS
jgi:hypothetical protein